MRGLLAVALLACVLAACAGAGNNGDKTPEEALADRAAGFYRALDDENFLRAHSFASPRFREFCSSDQFVSVARIAVYFYKGIGGGEDTRLEWKLNTVTVEGDIGRVYAEFLLDGEVADSGDDSDGDRWVFSDGQWWSEKSDWEEGCEL